jgi:hypothetical protein
MWMFNHQKIVEFVFFVWALKAAFQNISIFIYKYCVPPKARQYQLVGIFFNFSSDYI